MSIGNGNVFLGLIVDVDVVSLKHTRLRKLVLLRTKKRLSFFLRQLQPAIELAKDFIILDLWGHSKGEPKGE